MKLTIKKWRFYFRQCFLKTSMDSTVDEYDWDIVMNYQDITLPPISSSNLFIGQLNSWREQAFKNCSGSILDLSLKIRSPLELHSADSRKVIWGHAWTMRVTLVSKFCIGTSFRVLSDTVWTVERSRNSVSPDAISIIALWNAGRERCDIAVIVCQDQRRSDVRELQKGWRQLAVASTYEACVADAGGRDLQQQLVHELRVFEALVAVVFGWVSFQLPL